MSFGGQIAQFGAKAKADLNAVFVGTVVELRDSVKFGSALTGAPALPVAPSEFPRAGALRDSVTVTYPDPNTAIIYTDKLYARDVEDNTKGHTFHNGGPFGWRMTIAAATRVVEMVTKRITGYG